MARDAARRTVLMPIHPEYAEAILSGHKRVEFRKVALLATVEKILIYATAPVSKLVGHCSVMSIESSAPHELWRRYGRVGQIAKAEFERYYSGRSKGVAIRLHSPARFSKPLPLAELSPALRPPQGYHYLSLDPRSLENQRSSGRG